MNLYLNHQTQTNVLRYRANMEEPVWTKLTAIVVAVWMGTKGQTVR